MNKFKEFMINTLLSATIGVAVGATNLLMVLSRYISARQIIITLIISAFIGIIIGTVAKFIFELITMNIIKNIFAAYIIEGIVVVLMTWGVCLLFGSVSILQVVISSFVALGLAYIITYIQLRYWKEVNRKLKEFQEGV